MPFLGIPGIVRFIDVRTQWFDEAMEQAFDDGIQQVCYCYDVLHCYFFYYVTTDAHDDQCFAVAYVEEDGFLILRQVHDIAA
jgi:hypothetical protein